ncbi:hypothetical protein D3C84_385100 [compost metagenome]
MVLAVVDGDLEVLHRQACEGTSSQYRTHAFLHRRDELRGDHTTLHLVGEEETATARQRLDTQEYLAELAGAAGLFLVPAVAFGRAGDGFAVGHFGRARFHFQLVGAGDAVEQVAQVQFAHATQHGLLSGGLVVELHAGVFGLQPVQHFGNALFVATALGLDGQALHGGGEIQGFEVDLVFVMGVVQHRVEFHFVDLGQGAEVAGDQPRHFLVALALQA